MKARLKQALLSLLCCVAVPAWADDVLYKCIDGKGAVSIQSAPCPTGSKQAWKRDANAPPPTGTLPVPTPKPPSLSAPPPNRPPAVQSMPPARMPPPPEPAAAGGPPAVPAPDPCSHAQDVAAQLRDMPWLELTSEQQQRLLNWLMQQCRPAAGQN